MQLTQNGIDTGGTLLMYIGHGKTVEKNREGSCTLHIASVDITSMMCVHREIAIVLPQEYISTSQGSSLWRREC